MKKINKLYLFLIIFLLVLFSFVIFLLPINLKSFNIIKLFLSPNIQDLETFAIQYSQKNGVNYGLDLNITPNQREEPIEFGKEEQSDLKYLKDYSYITKGTLGKATDNYYTAEFLWRDFKNVKTFLKSREEINPINEISFTGSQVVEDLKADIQKKIDSILLDIKSGNYSTLNSYFVNSSATIVDNTNKVENISLKNLEFKDKIIEENKLIKSGKAIITLQNCKKDIEEVLIYNIETKVWMFENSQEFLSKLCSPQFIQNGDQFIGTCLDCSLYPANKKYGLRPDYAPSIQIFDLQNNALISTAMYEDLKNMFIDARIAGNSIVINSSYRSYSTQYNTFESWVQTEMNSGKSRYDAEIAANSYSARPGFSEHQLGTTLDIATDQCNAFGFGCVPNENMWLWLKNNAHLYGFSLSYPKDKESLTGYVFEPWHYRWIGKALALEFKSVEDTTILQEFLYNKNSY